MGAVILFHVVRGLQKLHEWYPNTHLLAISLAVSQRPVTVMSTLHEANPSWKQLPAYMM
jgi:hypothetical protein